MSTFLARLPTGEEGHVPANRVKIIDTPVTSSSSTSDQGSSTATKGGQGEEAKTRSQASSTVKFHAAKDAPSSAPKAVGDDEKKQRDGNVNASSNSNSSSSNSNSGSGNNARYVSSDNVRRRPTLFCLYAHYSAIMSSTFYSLTGLILLLWGAQGFSPVPGFSNPRPFNYKDVGVGLSVLLLGFSILLYEIRFGEARAGVNSIPFRGIFYLLACVPGFLALPTGVGAITMLIPSVINFYSTALGESYRPPPPARPAVKPNPTTNPSGAASASASVAYDKDESDELSTCARILAFVGGQNPDRQVGRVVFLILYIAGNIVAGSLHAAKAIQDIEDAKAFNAYNALHPTTPPTPDRPYHTYWIGMSKFFGNIMNFNYTFILIPVSHSLMRYVLAMYSIQTISFSFILSLSARIPWFLFLNFLIMYFATFPLLGFTFPLPFPYDCVPAFSLLCRWLVDSSRGKTWFGTIIRAVLWILPVDDAIKIHKLVAYVACGAALLHTVAHLFNYVARPVCSHPGFLYLSITFSINHLALFILLASTVAVFC